MTGEKRALGRVSRSLIGLAVLVAAMVPGTAFASPDNGASGEVYRIDESFLSMLWTEECGFDVWRRNYGFERIWEEPRGGGGIVFRGVFALTIELTGVESGNTYTFRDRGADRVRLLEDGSVELAVIGRSFPVNSIGRLVEIDDDVVSVAGRTAYDPAEICALLAP